jgi:hypothetical protein
VISIIELIGLRGEIAVLESTSHILSSFLHSLQIEFSDAVFVTDLLNKLSELEPRGGRPNVAVIDDVESLESVFKANLIDDHLLSHLRVRETVTRFLLVSDVFSLRIRTAFSTDGESLA